jgi:hypothetical protein
MSSYIFIETRSGAESPDVSSNLELAGSLAENGHDVTVYLVQNAVVDPRVPAGVAAYADDVSLEARGLDAPAGVHIGGMPDLVRLLMTPGVIPVWH